MALTGFVTRRRHGERSYKVYGVQWLGFRLLEKLNSQLSSKLGTCYLGDRAGGIHDLDDAQQHDPR
jgi:hypothetical protein